MDKRDLVSSVRTVSSSPSAPAVRRRLRTLVSVLALAFAVVGAVAPSEAIILTPGYILVVDGAHGLVLQVNPNDASTIVISADTNFVRAAGIAVAANGDLLVADPLCCGGGLIQVNPAELPDANQTIVSSGNTTPENNFVTPLGVAIAANGDLFVVDQTCCENGGVIQVNPVNGDQTILSTGGNFGSPMGIAIAPSGVLSGDLFVADPSCCDGSGGVIGVNLADGSQTVVSSGNNFNSPVGIAIAHSGDLFVADAACCGGQGGVIQVTPAGGAQRIVSSGGNLITPSGIAVAANGDLLVISGAGPMGGTNPQIIQVNPVDGTQVLVASQNDWFPTGIAIVPEPSRPASTCGGSVPCACGDRVVRDRTLRGVDPVTRTACPADGLVVADGVTLDLGGSTLRGQGAGAGVRIELGATNVTVHRGKITGFGTGLLGDGTTGVHLTNLQVLDNASDGVTLTGNGHVVEKALIQRNAGLGVAVVGNGSRLSNLQVRSNGRAGVRLVGSRHTLEQSVIESNGGHGAEVSGDANQVALLQVEGNGVDGVFLRGTGNTAARNIATRNGGDGLEIQGASATLDRNRATSNGEAGLEIYGAGHTVTQNIAAQNAGTGLQMVGTMGSRLDRNRGENNRGFGVTDNSTGGGTGGTANTYTGNLCGRGNGAGPSSPAGLCR